MNMKAVQGYIVAFGFLNYYKTENKIAGKMALVDKNLSMLSAKYKRNKINFEKYFGRGANFFEDYCSKNDTTISVLAFVLQLIIKNPDSKKHKQLTLLAKEINKDKLFSKDEGIFNAKVLVNRFYYPEKYIGE